MQVLTASELRAGVRALGLAGSAVCVHASLRSFAARIDGGPDALIDAFIDEDCTLLVPAFSDDFRIPPPADQRPPRNGWNYRETSAHAQPDSGRIFTPDSREVTVADMGLLAAGLVARPDRRRGNHPLVSFAAIGPSAEALIAPQQPLDSLAPLRVLAERGGFVLLMGVGLTAMTLIHLAEARAGRNLFRRWAHDRAGRPMMVETGGCSNGFAAFAAHLAPCARESVVGASRWRAFPVAAALTAATQAIRADPTITACANPGCERCRDAVAGGPLV